MRAVLQRVSEASVEVEGKIVGEIGQGWLVLLGVGQGDTSEDVAWMADKTVGLRAFEDEAGKMNLAVSDIGGAMLVVSQFTLYGDCRKGRRPGFSDAAPPEIAERLYEEYCVAVERLGVRVGRGVFRANMRVALVNEGPVTLMLDSRKGL